MRIRTARVADAADIEAVRAAGWRTAYRGLLPDAFLDAYEGDAERRRGYLERPERDVLQLVAVEDGAGEAVVGWSAGGASRDVDAAGTPTREILSCYVAPDRWRGGIGGPLLDAVLAALDARGPAETTLWVLRGNERAIAFYATRGFVPDGASQEPVLYGIRAPEIRLRRAGR